MNRSLIIGQAPSRVSQMPQWNEIAEQLSPGTLCRFNGKGGFNQRVIDRVTVSIDCVRFTGHHPMPGEVSEIFLAVPINGVGRKPATVSKTVAGGFIIECFTEDDYQVRLITTANIKQINYGPVTEQDRLDSQELSFRPPRNWRDS